MSAMMTMKDTSIKRLMLVVTVLVSIVLTGFMVASWLNADSLMQKTNEQRRLGNAMRDIGEARFHVGQVQRLLTDVGATADPEGYAGAQTELEMALRGLDRLESRMPELKQRLEEMKRLIPALHDEGVAMAKAFVSQGRAAGNAIMQRPIDGFDARSEAIEERMNDLVDRLDNRLSRATDILDEEERVDRLVIMALCVTMFVCMAITFGVLYAKVIPPLKNMLASLRDMNNGSGDLTRRLPSLGRDEVGDIVNEFNRFIGHLHGIVVDVARSSDRLNKTAERMLGEVRETEKGMRKQEGDMLHVASAMNEMSSTVQEVASNAARAADSTGLADKEATESKQVVSQTRQGNGALADEVERAAVVVHQLESESSNIGTILDVIRDIADQTNLLALNAAIEAARAGEQGRGFAVVADEVRSLAGRTQDSIQQIKTLIDRLQAGAVNAASAMDAGRGQAHRSAEQAADAEASLEIIVNAVDTIHQMSLQIASAAEEQSAVGSEINRNIHNISQVTEQISQGVKRSTTLCDDVMEESCQLQAQMSKFRY